MLTVVGLRIVAVRVKMITHGCERIPGQEWGRVDLQIESLGIRSDPSQHGILDPLVLSQVKALDLWSGLSNFIRIPANARRRGKGERKQIGITDEEIARQSLEESTGGLKLLAGET